MFANDGSRETLGFGAGTGVFGGPTGTILEPNSTPICIKVSCSKDMGLEEDLLLHRGVV